MPLSPLSSDKRFVVKATRPQPTKTYEFDVETGTFSGQMVDGKTALTQFIRKALATPRFRHLIYNAQYGSEVEDLIGAGSDMSLSVEYLDQELKRLIKETLIYDDRVSDVTDFVITRDQAKDSVIIEFKVVQTDGTITGLLTEVI